MVLLCYRLLRPSSCAVYIYLYVAYYVAERLENICTRELNFHVAKMRHFLIQSSFRLKVSQSCLPRRRPHFSPLFASRRLLLPRPLGLRLGRLCACTKKTGQPIGEWCPKLPTLPVVGKPLAGDPKSAETYPVSILDDGKIALDA